MNDAPSSPPPDDRARDETRQRRTRCPICGRPAASPEARKGGRSPFPFCSERCRLVDLGRWLDGAYQIPVEPDDMDEGQVPPDDSSPRP